MNRSIASIALVIALAIAGVAQAAPGNAIREAAQAHQLTPGGMFDAR